MKQFLIIISILIYAASFGQTDLIIEWQTNWINDSSYTQASEVKRTPDGGYVAVGSSGSNPSTLWIAKLNGAGEYQWLTEIPGSVGTGIITTSDGGYAVIGYTGLEPNYGLSDVLVAKLDGSGAIEWQEHYGGSHNDYGYAIVEKAGGGFVGAGSTRSPDHDVTGFHGGISADGWVFGITANGVLEWQRACGGTDLDYFRSIYSQPDGSLYVTGITESTDGDITGHHGQADMWLVHFDPQGEFLWQKCYGGTLNDRAHSLTPTLNGSLLLVGESRSSDGDVSFPNLGLADVWVVKVDSGGEILWDRSFGNPTGNIGYDVLAESDSTFTIAALNGSSGTANWWILHISEEGDLIWDLDLGGTELDASNGIDQPSSICASHDNKYIVCGRWCLNVNNNSATHAIIKFNRDFNVIAGTVFFDFSNDGEFNGADIGLPNKLVQENTSGRFAFTQSTGAYSLTVFEEDSLSCSALPIPPLTASPDSHAIQFTGLQQTIADQDFALFTTESYTDLKIKLTGSGIFRPNSYVRYYLTYTNYSPTASSATIDLELDPVMTYLGADLSPTLIDGNSFSWEIPSIPPYQGDVIIIDLYIPQDVTAGYVSDTHANILPIQDDLDPLNNYDQAWHIIVASYDPNDIRVNRDQVVIDEIPAGAWLDYTIRFQNTGNDTAFLVKIANSIPTNISFDSFEFLGSSHPVELVYNNEQSLLWFIFQEILLPDSNINELESHGFVRYQVKALSTLQVGDLITNTASIFFDFNAPINTNTATTEVVQFTSMFEALPEATIVVYPNPTASVINIGTVNATYRPEGITLYNASGQILQMITLSSSDAPRPFVMPLEHLPSGVYYLSIRTKIGLTMRKVVKL